VIGTTVEHPFFVPARGEFVAAKELQVGDELISHDGRLIKLDAIRATACVTTVYNMRVADHHTYFVGGSLWGFDVWVHNAACVQVDDGSTYYKQSQVIRNELANDPSLPSWKRAVFSNPADGSKTIGNVGLARANIDGMVSMIKAFSGNQKMTGYLDPVSSKMAKTLGVSRREIQDPSSHIEIKILAHLVSTTSQASKGTVTIFSELASCPSCSKALARFNELRPDITLRFRYRFDY